MASASPANPTGLKLCEFVIANNGSARLRNSLEAAAAREELPFETVAEYLASPAPSATLRSHVRSLGRRTALELDRMVHRLVTLGSDGSLEPPPPEELVAAELELRQELASVRLQSLLSSVPSESRLGRVLRSSIGDCFAVSALDDPDAVRVRVLGLGAVGAVTADELVTELRLAVSRRMRESGRSAAVHDALMVELFGSEPGMCWRGEPEDDSTPAMTREIVREVLGGADCASAFADAIVPVRLARLINTNGVGDRAIAEALIERNRVNLEVGRVLNIGQKTILEFWEGLWRRLAMDLVRAEATEENLAAIAALLQVDRSRLMPHETDLAEHEALRSANTNANDRPVPRNLDDALNTMLDRIKSQDRPVVRRRFGLDSGVGETLEEIGVSMKVTRERVRQIEKRGLRDLRVFAGKTDLRGALDADWPRAWDALADGDDLVTDVEFATFSRSVPGSISLALELLGLGLPEWLSRVSHRYDHGWLAPRRERGLVDAAIAAFDALPKTFPLPRSLRELELHGSPLDVEAALLIGRGLRTLHGYLVAGRVGTRLRRSLVAHALLAKMAAPMSLTALQRACQDAAPGDQFGTRDITSFMSEAPHLFIEVSEGRWMAVGVGGEIPPGGRRRELDVVEVKAAETDLTVAGAIRDELERAGPQTLAALMDSPKRYLPRDRSHNSVQPTLIMRPDLFARLLPGVYSLWSQVPDRETVLTGDVPYLLNEQQARIFAMARRAGEPWGAFPMWSPEAEYRLCRWAMREASADVRRSLLATATVDVWPLNLADRDDWRATCARDGRYDFVGTVRPAVFAVKPDLDRLLAALLDLEMSGRTSWMALNRVDGRHVASQMGCGLLSLLILSGAIVAPDQSTESAWQLSHAVCRQRTVEMRQALSGELHDRGSLQWSSDGGRMVAGYVLGGERLAPPWLPFRRFSEHFAGADSAPAATVEITPNRAADVGRSLLAERRMSDLLEWLDA